MFSPKLNETKPLNIFNSDMAVKKEAALCWSPINYLFKNLKQKKPAWNPWIHFNEKQKELPVQK